MATNQAMDEMLLIDFGLENGNEVLQCTPADVLDNVLEAEKSPIDLEMPLKVDPFTHCTTDDDKLENQIVALEEKKQHVNQRLNKIKNQKMLAQIEFDETRTIFENYAKLECTVTVYEQLAHVKKKYGLEMSLEEVIAKHYLRLDNLMDKARAVYENTIQFKGSNADRKMLHGEILAMKTLLCEFECGGNPKIKFKVQKSLESVKSCLVFLYRNKAAKMVKDEPAKEKGETKVFFNEKMKITNDLGGSHKIQLNNEQECMQGPVNNLKGSHKIQLNNKQACMQGLNVPLLPQPDIIEKVETWLGRGTTENNEPNIDSPIISRESKTGLKSDSENAKCKFGKITLKIMAIHRQGFFRIQEILAAMEQKISAYQTVLEELDLGSEDPDLDKLRNDTVRLCHMTLKSIPKECIAPNVDFMSAVCDSNS